jgi:hypothetical protein
MPERQRIAASIAELARALDRLAAGHSELCASRIDGSGTAGTDSAFAELEEVRVRAESLRRDLDALKGRSKLDPKVLDLENKLENVLTRYYLLWQKCKTDMT